MTRRHLTFTCEGASLCGTLDAADGGCGLLIASGGNELRSGAWAGQAQLAARLARSGHPVLRYDRRGVGDSEGENGGFASGAADLAAALDAFRKEMPQLRRIVAFGNCDGASALALFGSIMSIDALVLANPWTVDGNDEAAPMPAKAIRARYLKKAMNPKEWLRLLTGNVNFKKLASGMRAAASTVERPSRLAEEMREALGTFSGPISILLAEHDRTAQLFEAAWPQGDERVRRFPSRSHSFSDDAAQAWLEKNLLAALNG